MRRICTIAVMALVASTAGLSAQEARPRDSRRQAGAERAEPPARQAVPRESRPQGDNPQTGTAVPRTSRREAPPRDTRSSPPPSPRGRTTVLVRPPVPRSGYYYRYSPRPIYPYGYGVPGFGTYYYDPYATWSPGVYPGVTSGYYRPYSSFDIGELRFEVSPRTAQVYVDGYYAGLVDDFDGAFQALKLTEGAYRIEIMAQGYDTVVFDVRMTPGQKVTYRGDLHRLPW